MKWAAVLLATVLVAACSATGSSASRPATPGATPGGTLVVGITAPGSIDPSDAYEPAGEQVLATVCEPVVTFDPLTAKPAAGMTASSIVTSGGRLVSIRLRSGIHFQNGATVISSDVRDELSRVASVANASVDSTFLSDFSGYDVIHGDVDSNNALALRQLTGISTLSNSAFSVELAHADGDLFSVLGAVFTAPVPRTLADSDPGSLSTKPVCAGPYELAQPWAPGQSDIVVTRFNGYYGRNPSYPSGGVGYPDKIDFRIFATQADELAALNAGTIEIASIPDTSLRSAGGSVVSAPNGYVEYLGLPNGTGTSVFNQPAVHVALSQALDRGALNAAAYGGGALAADGFFPPTVGGVYRPGACGASTPSTADPAAATATLGRAAISLSGRPLKLYYNDQFGNRPLAEAIAREWEQNLGLHVLLTPEPWDQYLAQANSATGFDGAFLEAWQSPYPSADAYLYPMFDSASVGTDNFAHYIDPTFDREMTNVARAATSTASRTLAYQHLAAGLCQRLPLVPLLFRQWHYGVRTTQVGSAIGSFTDAATGLLDLREVYVRP